MLRSAAVVPEMIYSKVSVAVKEETFLRSSGSVAKQGPTVNPTVTGILNTQLEVKEAGGGLGGIYGQSEYLSVYLNIENGVGV